MQLRHLPPLLRFISQFAQICIIFALSKFQTNPFFRRSSEKQYFSPIPFFFGLVVGQLAWEWLTGVLQQ